MKTKIAVAAAIILLGASVFVFFKVRITIPEKKGPPKLGSPDFTEALDSTVLPPLPPKFGGEIKKLTVELEPIQGTLGQIPEFKWKTRDWDASDDDPRRP
jgi:hypothetical protein